MSGSAGKRTKKAGGHSAIFKLEEDQSSSDSGGTSSTVQAVSTPPIGPIIPTPPLGNNQDFFFQDETGLPPRVQQLFGTKERPVVVHQHTGAVPRIAHRYIGERGEPVEEIFPVPVPRMAPGWTNNGNGNGNGNGGGTVLRGLMGSGITFLGGVFVGLLIDRHFVVMVMQTVLLAVIVTILLGVWFSRRR